MGHADHIFESWPVPASLKSDLWEQWSLQYQGISPQCCIPVKMM